MGTNNTLPKQAIEDFKKLYTKKFKKELADDEATKHANALFALYMAVYGTPR